MHKIRIEITCTVFFNTQRMLKSFIGMYILMFMETCTNCLQEPCMHGQVPTCTTCPGHYECLHDLPHSKIMPNLKNSCSCPPSQSKIPNFNCILAICQLLSFYNDVCTSYISWVLSPAYPRFHTTYSHHQ